MTRKGMAYGRMRQIDKMTPDEFRALSREERDLYVRTEMPVAQRMEVMERLRQQIEREGLPK